MKRLLHSDGSRGELLDNWRHQCHEFDEDFETFTPATIPSLGEQIEVCANERWSGVYAVENEKGEVDAVCFLNGAFIPKFTGRVLRVRHLILAPKYDFGDYSQEQYASLLSNVFESVLKMSDSQLPCSHVKVHFRSPADVALFRDFAPNLNEGSHFSSVKMVGSWLFVTKREPVELTVARENLLRESP